MAKREKRQKKLKDERIGIEEYLKSLPAPPEEHTHELKMERRLRHLLEEQEKKRAKKNLS